MVENKGCRKASTQNDFHPLLTDLKACSIRRELHWGRRIHAKAVESRNDANIYVVTALVKMYTKFGNMIEARRIFDSLQKPNVVSWNVLLLGYAENGDGFTSLELFSTMKVHRCIPSSITYVAVLKACTALVTGDGSERGECLQRGRQIHWEIGCHLDHYLQNMLIDMYSRCGSMVEAFQVFESIQTPDVVSWTSLLLGYAENGEGLVALELFSKMKTCGCTPNSITYVAALKACTLNEDGSGKEECLERGREIHSEIGCNLDQYLKNTLIDMYANCGSMVEARCIFDSVYKPDVVSWTALLLGYVENGEALVALDLFSRMKACGCAPDSVSYVAALKACGLIGALSLGRKFHKEITEFTSRVISCLVDFYAKCGSMTEAHEVFDLHPRSREISTWNALLAGYARFGDTDSVFNLFDAMHGFRPNAVTFVCILSSCNHAGLVEKARYYFEAMAVHYRVTPTVVHYNCMVDVLGRANQLNEAILILQKMPCNPDAVSWRALLGACCKWKNVALGKLAFGCLVDLDKKDASAYVVIADLYGSMGMWKEQQRVLETRQMYGAWKLQGQAYVLDEFGKIDTF